MIEQLNNCKTREEARGLIEHMSKKELMEMAYYSDIYVKESLDKEMVIDRIVASTVGMTIMFKTFMGEDFSNNRWN